MSLKIETSLGRVAYLASLREAGDWPPVRERAMGWQASCHECGQADYVADHKPWRIAAITNTAPAIKLTPRPLSQS